MTVTDASFTVEVERSPLPMVLDMWAAWCELCHRIAPVIEAIR